MNYQNLYIDFKNKFPEENEFFSNIEKENNLNYSDGIHTLFGFTTIPFLLKLLNNNDYKKLKNCFSFYEEMINSNDKFIEEVLEFTILENIIDLDEKDISKLKNLMGKNTLICFKNLEKFSS